MRVDGDAMVLEELSRGLVEGLLPCVLLLKRRKVDSLWCGWVLCSTLLLVLSPRADRKSSEALISVEGRAEVGARGETVDFANMLQVHLEKWQ
jgi:hypothetical protein